MMMNCQKCGMETARRSATQLYCEPCSTEKSLERKRQWARRHHASPDVRRRYGQASSERANERGKQISATEAKGIGESYSPDPELSWIVRVAMPFSYAASKNSVWGFSTKGHVWKRREGNAYRGQLTTLIRSQIASGGIKVKQARLWVDVLVQKSNHKGDAVNVVDLVCDAIKDAIDLDDRWYSIRRLDWQIIKHDPQLFVGIGQEVTEDLQACSTCGRLLTYDKFGRNKSKENGIARVCLECRRNS